MSLLFFLHRFLTSSFQNNAEEHALQCRVKCENPKNKLIKLVKFNILVIEKRQSYYNMVNSVDCR